MSKYRQNWPEAGRETPSWTGDTLHLIMVGAGVFTVAYLIARFIFN